MSLCIVAVQHRVGSRALIQHSSVFTTVMWTKSCARLASLVVRPAVVPKQLSVDMAMRSKPRASRSNLCVEPLLSLTERRTASSVSLSVPATTVDTHASLSLELSFQSVLGTALDCRWNERNVDTHASLSLLQLPLSNLRLETALDRRDGATGAARLAGHKVQSVLLAEQGIGTLADLARYVLDCVVNLGSASTQAATDQCTCGARSRSVSGCTAP